MTIPLADLSPSPSSCQPEPARADGAPPNQSQARGSYLALLLVGLAMPSLLPATRWSLKPPFHPYLACKAVCFLWRYPSDFSAQALPGTIPSRSPDFPRRTPQKGRNSAVIQPSTHGLALTPVSVSGQRQAARAEPCRKVVHHRTVHRIKRAHVPRTKPLTKCPEDCIHTLLTHRIAKL